MKTRRKYGSLVGGTPVLNVYHEGRNAIIENRHDGSGILIELADIGDVIDALLVISRLETERQKRAPDTDQPEFDRGRTDATAGFPPSSGEKTYLEGYLAGLS